MGHREPTDRDHVRRIWQKRVWPEGSHYRPLRGKWQFYLITISITRDRLEHVTVTPGPTPREYIRGVTSDSSSDSKGVTQGVGDEGYIRTLPHVLSLVLRLQSYIVTCVYLLDYCDSLLDYNLTTLTSRPILRYRSTRRSTWHQFLDRSKGLRLL